MKRGMNGFGLLYPRPPGLRCISLTLLLLFTAMDTSIGQLLPELLRIVCYFLTDRGFTAGANYPRAERPSRPWHPDYILLFGDTLRTFRQLHVLSTVSASMRAGMSQVAWRILSEQVRDEIIASFGSAWYCRAYLDSVFQHDNLLTTAIFSDDFCFMALLRFYGTVMCKARSARDPKFAPLFDPMRRMRLRVLAQAKEALRIDWTKRPRRAVTLKQNQC